MATVPIGAIYPEGVQNVVAGYNSMDLHQGSQAAVDHVVEFLAAHTKTITTTAEIAHVSTIFANGDKHVGNLIAQAMERRASSPSKRAIRSRMQSRLHKGCGFIVVSSARTS